MADVDLEGEGDSRWVRGVRLHCPCVSDGWGCRFEKDCVRTIRTETWRGCMVDVWAMRHLICHAHVQEDIVVHISTAQFIERAVSDGLHPILFHHFKMHREDPFLLCQIPNLANHAATAAAATISHLITSGLSACPATSSMVTLTSSGEERGSN